MQNASLSNVGDFAVKNSKKKRPEISGTNYVSFNNFPNMLLKFAMTKPLPLPLKVRSLYLFNEADFYLR